MSRPSQAIAAALAGLDAAPLSRKRAMLVALLLDAEIDRLCIARGEPDLLAARAALAAAHPALALVMDLAALRDDGPRLVIEQVALSAADYAALGEADYMVSLYNGATVPRVRVALADGSRLSFHEVLGGAEDALERLRVHPRSSIVRPPCGNV